jgi:O-antigen/teichoic acid export membrane protein
MASIGLACLCSLLFLQRSIRSLIRKIKPKFEFTRWTGAIASFFLANILYIINSRIDILLLGLFKDNDAIGVYNIALKLSGAAGIVLAIVNFVIAPFIVRLNESGQIAELQKVITKSARITMLLSAPLIFLLLLFKRNILTFFGIDFLAGDTAFVILSVGQICNVIFGSVGTLLLMSGNQRFSIYSLIASIVFNILCNITLTPRYGVTGTAIATAVSMIVWNLLMYIFVRKKLNIRTTFTGIA